MLAHSPPLPLVIDYSDKCGNITAEDEEGAILALKQRGRVRRVRLGLPVSNLHKLIVATDGEYPILEYLVIVYEPEEQASTVLIFPETLQAPHLRHLRLEGFTLPTRSRLLTTAVGLVTLCLFIDDLSAYFQPDTLLQWISFMPQLETLTTIFPSIAPRHDIESQRTTHMSIIKPLTLPNLHRLSFRGASNYLEALVHQLTTPRLEKLEIAFFNEPAFSLPRLMQVMNTTENLRLDSVKFVFSTWQAYVDAYPPGESEMFALSITVNCWHLDRQVPSMAQICNSLNQIFSAVKHLTLEYKVTGWLPEVRIEVDRIEWRKLLRSFSNVKTLRIDNWRLVEEISRCLQSDDGELSFELLPELQELTYSGHLLHLSMLARTQVAP
jgi:hypothetical protein